MACYRPIEAWYGERNISGKNSIVFTANEAVRQPSFLIPCGKCVGCRLEKARQWAMRCYHESLMWEKNCFLTLTYNDENLPKDGSIHKEDFQKFMKLLRYNFPEDKIRYYHAAEYGEVCAVCGKTKRFPGAKDYCKCTVFVKTLGRPHYHACLFNFDFPDKEYWSMGKHGDKLYVSKKCNEIWGKGYTVLGDVTFESAEYVARYIMKKINGDMKEAHYAGKNPEICTMSRG